MAQMVREARLKFTRELPTALAVRGVDAEGIRINEQVYCDAIALTPQEMILTWKPSPFSELTCDDFEPLLEHAPKLVIVGTGARSQFPPRELTFAFARLGIGLEIMDTSAAARTFNVLAGEGRLVAAILYPE